MNVNHTALTRSSSSTTTSSSNDQENNHHHHRSSADEVRQAAGSQSVERLQRAVVGWTAYELDEVLSESGDCGSTGKSALHMAAWKGCLGNVKFLVEELGCSVNAYSKAHFSYGKTAIFFALTQSRVTVVEYLLTVPGICVSIVNNKGQSVRSLAASHDMPPTILEKIQQLEMKPYQNWWNFRATHSDGLEYGDLDPRFLDRPLRPSDKVTEHAINLTCKRTRPGGFARRNPTIVRTTPAVEATVPLEQKQSRMNQRRRRQQQQQQLHESKSTALTQAEEIIWEDTLQTLRQIPKQTNVDDESFIEALVTIVKLGVKQRRTWVPEVVQALSVATKESTGKGNDSWLANNFDQAMSRVLLTREVESESTNRWVALLERLRQKQLSDLDSRSVEPSDVGKVPKTTKNDSKPKWSTSRKQAQDLWRSHSGQWARQQVAGLSIQRDLEHGTDSLFLQLPEVPRFVDALPALMELINELAHVSLVAIDTEWFDGESDDDDGGLHQCRLSTIQIAYVCQPGSVVASYVIDLKMATSSVVYQETARTMISSILERPETLVLGFSIGHDIKILEHFLGRKLQPCTILDLQLLLGEGTLGLKACVARYCHTPLSKEEQCSEWGQRPLRRSQLHYAGLDAAILLYLLGVYDPPTTPRAID